MPFGRNLFDEGTTVAYWRVHFLAGTSLLCLTFVCGQPAARAQDYPRWEAFGGFSYANVGLGPQSSSFAPKGKNYYGMHLSVNFNPARNLSLQLLDLGMQSGGTKLRPLSTKSDITVNTSQALFGPQLTMRRPKANVFGHALIGVTNTRLVRSNSFNSFDLVSKTNLALGFGGGVDLNLTPRLAVRLVQADYIPTRLSGVWQSDYRVSVGIVFRFKYTENWRSR